MKGKVLVGYIASLTVSLLIPFINPAPAVADVTSAVRKVVLLDLFDRGGISPITPDVGRVTFVDSYALANWRWGQGGGETVLINENDQWRVIVAGQGTLNPSTLVQYGIPRDMARTLINRDKGAPEEQPPLANLFVPLLPQLQQQTDALILLPSQLPPFKQPIYVQSQIRRNSYRINLNLKPNCDGAETCTIGSLTAEPVDPVYYPSDLLTKKIPLENDIWGYFTPSQCYGICTAPIMEWVWQDTTYRIELTGIGRTVNEEEAVMVAIVNSAIAAGPR